MASSAPTAPVAGDSSVILGAGTTVKFTPLLAWPDTLTTTFPDVAPLDKVTVMLDEPQVVTEAAVPLNCTVLVPWVDPKLVPKIVMEAPMAAEVGERLVIEGVDCACAPITKRKLQEAERNRMHVQLARRIRLNLQNSNVQVDQSQSVQATDERFTANYGFW